MLLKVTMYLIALGGILVPDSGGRRPLILTPIKQRQKLAYPCAIFQLDCRKKKIV